MVVSSATRRLDKAELQRRQLDTIVHAVRERQRLLRSIVHRVRAAAVLQLQLLLSLNSTPLAQHREFIRLVVVVRPDVGRFHLPRDHGRRSASTRATTTATTGARRAAAPSTTARLAARRRRGAHAGRHRRRDRGGGRGRGREPGEVRPANRLDLDAAPTATARASKAARAAREPHPGTERAKRARAPLARASPSCSQDICRATQASQRRREFDESGDATERSDADAAPTPIVAARGRSTVIATEDGIEYLDGPVSRELHLPHRRYNIAPTPIVACARSPSSAHSRARSPGGATRRRCAPNTSDSCVRHAAGGVLVPAQHPDDVGDFARRRRRRGGRLADGGGARVGAARRLRHVRLAGLQLLCGVEFRLELQGVAALCRRDQRRRADARHARAARGPRHRLHARGRRRRVLQDHLRDDGGRDARLDHGALCARGQPRRRLRQGGRAGDRGHPRRPRRRRGGRARARRERGARVGRLRRPHAAARVGQLARRRRAHLLAQHAARRPRVPPLGRDGRGAHARRVRGARAALAAAAARAPRAAPRRACRRRLPDAQHLVQPHRTVRRGQLPAAPRVLRFERAPSDRLPPRSDVFRRTARAAAHRLSRAERRRNRVSARSRRGQRFAAALQRAGWDEAGVRLDGCASARRCEWGARL